MGAGTPGARRKASDVAGTSGRKPPSGDEEDGGAEIRAFPPREDEPAAEVERPAAGTLPARQAKVLDVIRELGRAVRLPAERARDRRGGRADVDVVGRATSCVPWRSKGYLRRDPNRPRAVGVLPATDRRPHGHELPSEADFSDQPMPAYVPVVGRIAAGGPMLAEQAIEDVFPLPREIVGEGSLFMLKVDR